MAIFDWSEVENDIKRYLKPYKTFRELETGDLLYVVDFEKMVLVPCKIVSSEKLDRVGLSAEAMAVTIKYEVNDREMEANIYRGNSFLYYDSDFLCTDDRIGEFIIDILRARNSYQWNAFTKLFGDPMENYAHKPVILG